MLSTLHCDVITKNGKLSSNKPSNEECFSDNACATLSLSETERKTLNLIYDASSIAESPKHVTTSAIIFFFATLPFCVVQFMLGIAENLLFHIIRLQVTASTEL